MPNLESTFNAIPRKPPDREMKRQRGGQTDGQAIIYKTIPSTARGQKFKIKPPKSSPLTTFSI